MSTFPKHFLFLCYTSYSMNVFLSLVTLLALSSSPRSGSSGFSSFSLVALPCFSQLSLMCHSAEEEEQITIEDSSEVEQRNKKRRRQENSRTPNVRDPPPGVEEPEAKSLDEAHAKLSTILHTLKDSLKQGKGFVDGQILENLHAQHERHQFTVALLQRKHRMMTEGQRLGTSPDQFLMLFQTLPGKLKEFTELVNTQKERHARVLESTLEVLRSHNSPIDTSLLAYCEQKWKDKAYASLSKINEMLRRHSAIRSRWWAGFTPFEWVWITQHIAVYYVLYILLRAAVYYAVGNRHGGFIQCTYRYMLPLFSFVIFGVLHTESKSLLTLSLTRWRVFVIYAILLWVVYLCEYVRSVLRALYLLRRRRGTKSVIRKE